MKTKRMVMSENDYDLYSLHLPMSVLFGKNRNKFIETELEKRHPCYSDDFCFENKLKFAKKGLETKVIVMNKLRLSELKEKFGNKRLYAKDFGAFVFDSGGMRVWKKVYFGVILGIFGGGILWGNLYFGKTAKKRTEIIDVTQADKNSQNVIETGKIALTDFFEIVKTNNGHINWFEWRFEETQENFSSSVRDLYPEQFYERNLNVEISSVSYSGGVPLMVVSGKNIVLGKENRNDLPNYVFYIPLLRDVLRKNNVEIYEENQNPFSIKFSFKDVAGEDGNVISQISKVVKENELAISYLMLKYTDKDTFEVQINFSKTGQKGIDLSIVGENLFLFKLQKQSKQSQISVPKTTSVQKVSGTKIGEVSYEDGTKSIFYKTENGKLKIVKN